jgi:hypothetical protein
MAATPRSLELRALAQRLAGRLPRSRKRWSSRGCRSASGWRRTRGWSTCRPGHRRAPGCTGAAGSSTASSPSWSGGRARTSRSGFAPSSLLGMSIRARSSRCCGPATRLAPAQRLAEDAGERLGDRIRRQPRLGARLEASRAVARRSAAQAGRSRRARRARAVGARPARHARARPGHTLELAPDLPEVARARAEVAAFLG